MEKKRRHEHIRGLVTDHREKRAVYPRAEQLLLTLLVTNVRYRLSNYLFSETQPCINTQNFQSVGPGGRSYRNPVILNEVKTNVTC